MVWMSSVNSKYSIISGTDFEIRESSVGLSGVSSVRLAILSVGVRRHAFWFGCQCRMERRGQCQVLEKAPFMKGPNDLESGLFPGYFQCYLQDLLDL